MAPRVGGEVDAFCTRCQLVLAHTVIAMVGASPVRVECNTCRGVHAWRGKTPRAVAPRAERTTQRRSFDDLLAEHAGPSRRYFPAESYAAGDVVDHPTFGRGFVSGARDPGKVEVTFRAGVKTLVQGRR